MNTLMTVIDGEGLDDVALERSAWSAIAETVEAQVNLLPLSHPGRPDLLDAREASVGSLGSGVWLSTFPGSGPNDTGAVIEVMAPATGYGQWTHEEEGMPSTVVPTPVVLFVPAAQVNQWPRRLLDVENGEDWEVIATFSQDGVPFGEPVADPERGA